MKRFSFRKTFLASMIFFLSFTAFAQERSLQELFFSATAGSITGFYAGQEEKSLGEANERAKDFYSRRIARFDENERIMISCMLCELFNMDKLGQIDSTYCPEDVFAVETESEVSDSNSGDWIDQAILAASMPSQEKVPAAYDGETLLEMLESSDSRGIEEQSEEQNDEEDKPKAEFIYTDKQGSVRRFFYDDEGMSVSSYDGQVTVSRNYGQATLRKTFDSLFRLVKIESFSVKSNSKSIKLDNLKLYSYSGDSVIPEKMSEEDNEKNLKTETSYYENGLAKSVQTGHYEDEEEKKSEKKKSASKKSGTDAKNSLEVKKIFFVDKEQKFTYDDKKRICDDETIVWQYKKSIYGKMITTTTKTSYSYTYKDSEEDNFPPDYDFYEDDSLRLTRKYRTAENYTETMYFNDGFSVEVFYENGVKKRERIFINNVEARSRSFE